DRGTCLNLGRGGMFIATDRPAEPGTEVMIHFTPPDLSNPLSLLARVEWMYGDKTAPGRITGMGVQFLNPRPSEAALIGAVVDRLRGEAPPSPGSAGSFPSSG
ncbi:MAG: PilZ domain-containing protein, partial [Candidatus Methylomirabilales bacterium]